MKAISDQEEMAELRREWSPWLSISGATSDALAPSQAGAAREGRYNCFLIFSECFAPFSVGGRR